MNVFKNAIATGASQNQNINNIYKPITKNLLYILIDTTKLLKKIINWNAVKTNFVIHTSFEYK